MRGNRFRSMTKTDSSALVNCHQSPPCYRSESTAALRSGHESDYGMARPSPPGSVGIAIGLREKGTDRWTSVSLGLILARTLAALLVWTLWAGLF
jgi:hypothetical protein